MNKLRIIYIVLFSVIFSSFYLIHFSLGSEADFYIVNVSPTQVKIGNIYILNITLKNLGTRYAVYLNSKLDPEDISPIDPIGPAKKYIGKAKESSETNYFGLIRQNEEIKISYPIKIKPNTPEGTYFIPLILNWKDNTLVPKMTTLFLNIFVEDINPIIEVEKVTPDSIKPGDDLNITLILTNKGEDIVKNVKLKVNTNITSILLPQTPNNIYLSELKPKEKYIIKMEFVTNENANPGIYSIPIVLEYKGNDGIIRQQNEIVAVKIKGMAKLNIAKKSTDPPLVKIGEPFTLILKIENIGKADAKGVKAYLQSCFSGDNTAYLGKIEKNDYANAIFTLFADRTQTKNKECKLKIIYEDDFGTKELNEPISIVIYPKQSQNGFIFIGIIMVIAIIAILKFKLKR